MSWTVEINYCLTGTITTGLTLDNTNPEAGSIPSGFLTYGDDNYGGSNYAPTAIYQAVYSNLPSAYKEFVFDYSCGTGDIFYQYQTSEEGSSYTAWSSAIDVSVDNDLTTRAPYHRFRFIFYSPYWTDEDEILVDSITDKFIIFAAGETISALEMNSNYGYVGQGNLLPRGSNSMVATNLAYDLGSDIRVFENVYINNLNLSGNLYDGLNLIASVTLSAPTDRIEFTGLDGDTDQVYYINARITGEGPTGQACYVKMTFNGDSTAANFGEQLAWAIPGYVGGDLIGDRYNGAYAGIFLSYFPSSITGRYTPSQVDVILYADKGSGFNRTGLISTLYKSSAVIPNEAVTDHIESGFIWNNFTTTLSTIQFIAGDANLTATTASFMEAGTHIEIWTKKVAT